MTDDCSVHANDVGSRWPYPVEEADRALDEIPGGVTGPDIVTVRRSRPECRPPVAGVVATAGTYDQLRDACVARRNELGLSQLDVDEIAGLQTGYTAKLECGDKRMGAMSLSVLLQALGLELVVVRKVPHHLRHSAKQAA